MSSLSFESEQEVLRQPDRYAFVDVQRYRIEEDVPDRELLDALLRCDAYSNFRYDVGSEGTHGPWLQEALVASMFEPCESPEAIAALNAWLSGDRPATARESSSLTDAVVPLLRGTVYRLSPGFEGPLSIGATWLEFAAIDRTVGRLSLVVAWDD